MEPKKIALHVGGAVVLIGVVKLYGAYQYLAGGAAVLGGMLDEMGKPRERSGRQNVSYSKYRGEAE